MYEPSRGRFLSAFPPRLLVLTISFFASILATLIAVTCFILALDKRSDPNAAVSLPGSQKFATFFTAAIFLAITPIPLIAFLSTLVHTRQRYSAMAKSTRSKVYNLVTLQRLPLPFNQPFLYLSPKSFRMILIIALFVQFAVTIAFTIVVCIMKNGELCLLNGRVVLCNLLTSTQKVAVIVPAFLQISSEFALLLLIKPYTHQVENESGLPIKYEEVYGSLKGTKAQGPFQRIPIFDPDVEYENGDLEEGIDLADTRYDRGSSKPIPVRPANRGRTSSFDYPIPYDDPSGGTPSSGEFKQTSFKKFSKPLRTLSTSSTGSHMQGPRPAPKRSGTLVSVSVTSPTTVNTPTSINSGKNKEWFKRFKSKTVEPVVDEDEENENENEGGENETLVVGSERKRTRTSKKRSDNNQEGDGGDADGEDEGLL